MFFEQIPNSFETLFETGTSPLVGIFAEWLWTCGIHIMIDDQIFPKVEWKHFYSLLYEITTPPNRRRNQNELMSTSRIVSTSTRDHRPLRLRLMLLATIMTGCFHLRTWLEWSLSFLNKQKYGISEYKHEISLKGGNEKCHGIVIMKSTKI